MKISVAYAKPERQWWLECEVKDGATIEDGINASGILKRCPEIDLEKQKVGIFGKVAKLDAPLEEGMRIEIYRPLLVDPKTVPKKKKKA
ncbi:RnfH family protein [Zymomonas sp.]|uniref:RnfH family protein n=1 Tax=Zymomonas sp. TaxID=2068624 RepID=UPI0025D824CB|nr:RnfH family protein [Zymomonas sp.]MCA1956718.1 RnfH family protein [Zymomonas sp.]